MAYKIRRLKNSQKHRLAALISPKCIACSAFLSAIIIGAVVTINYRFKNSTDMSALDETVVESLLDISTLSESSMASYLSEIATLNKVYDADHTIIVTSLIPLKDNFGAAKVVSAPNHQYFLYFDSEEAKSQALAVSGNNSSILFAEPDETVEISAYNSWGIEDMGLDRAISGIDLENANDVTVAIIDTGCDLALFNESFNGRIEDTYNLYDSYMHDSNGHGTHIAGTIAEGTSANVKILPVKVSDTRSMRTSSIITAINYINYYRKADVINMSFGSSSGLKSEFVAIQAAMENGIISVVAAGNESSSTGNSFPAAWDNTISVSAVDSAHELADFSNYGAYITFAAPGVDIQSINGTMSGTSMATPHVVSAVAMLKSINKNLALDQIIDILKTTAIDLGTEGRDNYYGYGFIDMSDFGALAEVAKKANSTNNFEVTDASKVVAHYGNITNLMNIPVTVTNAAGHSYDATLSDLDGLIVSGYDAFASGEQEIQLTWDGITKTITVNNGSTGGNTSYLNTVKLGDQEVAIGSIDYAPKKVYIPASINGRTVSTIGDGDTNILRNGTYSIEHVILPTTVHTIRPKAFYNISTLESVTGSTEYISIGAQAFYADYNLSVFEPKISALGESAFYNTSIVQATLFDDITIIPTSAFQGCEYLTTLNLPSSLVEIGDYALSETNISSFDFPASFTTLGTDALKDLFGLENITVASENPIYDSRGSSNALIETATNTIILGSSNTVIPDTATSIADYAFYGNKKIQTIYTNNVEYIGQQAFHGCVSLHEFHIENVALTANGMLYQRFSGDSSNKYGNIPNLIVFDDASTSYGSLNTMNDLSGQHVPAYIVTSKTSIELSADQSYAAFDEVKNLSINIQYSGMAGYPYVLNETIENYTIEYQNGDSFRAGDTSFIVHGVNQFGKPFEYTFDVTVSKATPTYTAPANLIATYEERIGNIALPEGFQWSSPNTIIDAPGSFYARYIPSDTDNYETVENISISVQVTAKNASTDYTGLYDGSGHTITPSFEPSTVTIKYSLDGKNYNLDTLPTFTNIGRHTVYYLVTNPNFVDLTGSNDVYIYGIENFGTGITIKDNNIVADWGNTFSSIARKISPYSGSTTPIKQHIRGKTVISSETVKTGDKIKIIMGAYEKEYILIIRGDVDGNGDVGVIDYIRIKKDIMDIEKLSGIYYEAADMNSNNEIDVIDYIRIKKIIMEKES